MKANCTLFVNTTPITMNALSTNEIEKFYELLIKKISLLSKLDVDDVKLIKSLFHFEHYPKDEPIIRVGEFADKAYYIISGYMKYYKLLDSGDDLIIHLYAPDNFAASLDSFFNEERSKEELTCITDCYLFSITRADLEILFSTNEKWGTFGRKLMESFLIEKEERIIDQISLTAQQRYIKLIETNPGIVQNVPIKLIASFIGVKPESLSRIRKQIN